MPKVNLSHFEAAVLFAIMASIVLGIVSKRTQKEQLHYALYCFGCFIAAIFGLGHKS